MFESASVAPSTKDALEEYLATPPTKSITDPIGYWDLHLRLAQNDPGAVALGRMAMNFLTIPGTPLLTCSPASLLNFSLP